MSDGGAVGATDAERRDPRGRALGGTLARIALLLGVAVVVAAIDLGTKSWATSALSDPRPPTQLVETCAPDANGYTRTTRLPRTRIELLPVLRLKYAENCGGPFGFLRTASADVRFPVFVGATALAIVALFIVGLGARGRPLVGIALASLTGGAIGNMVDRVRLGYVVDFIDVHAGTYAWPTFNVADIGVTVGLVLVVIDSIRAPKDLDRPAEPPRDPIDPIATADTTVVRSPEARGDGPLDPPAASA